MSDKHLLKKEFSPSSWSVDNSATIYVLTVLIFLAGIYAFLTLPRESFPEISQPQVFISTPYPGSSAIDVEKLVTDPLEQELNRLQDLKEIRSNSSQGFSMVIVEFTFDVNSTEGLRRVKDKVDQALSQPEWPQDLPAPPTLIEFSLSELVPILNINLSGNYTVDQLYDIAFELKEDIERVQSVSKSEIRGADEREVEIAVDLPKMQSLEISFGDIANAIQQENIDASAGELLENKQRRTIRVNGQYKNTDQIKNTIIKRDRQEVVYLKDIAEVTFKQPEQMSYAMKGDNPVVMLDVMKRTGENIINTTNEINKVLEKAKAKYIPTDIDITVTNDSSVRVGNMVNELVNSIILGMILVIVVLMFFLGFRNALFVGIAIPMSMLLSFAVLSFMGITLNNIVLFSLVMALGMLVDNGIVVVENIYRLIDEEKMGVVEATKQGAGEVALPVIASTLTTLAGFVPLMFWEGIMGEFMKWLPITLIVVLLSSLFVALIINPMLTSKYMKLNEGKEKIVSSKDLRKQSLILGSIGGLSFIIALITDIVFFRVLAMGLILWLLLGWAYKFFLEPGTYKLQNKYMPALEEKYRQLLDFLLRGHNPLRVFISMFVLLAVSFVLFGAFTPKVVFFPEGDPSQVVIYMSEPIGADLQETNELLKDAKDKIDNILDEFIVTEQTEDGRDTTFNFLVKSVILQSGTGSQNPDDGPGASDIPHKAKITIEMDEYKYRRGVSTSKVSERIREALDKYPGVEVIVSKSKNGPPQDPPINIELKADDYLKLLDLSKKFIAYINEQNILGIEKLTVDVEDGKPELTIEVDREKARTLNISTAQVGDALRTSLFGKTVSTYKYNEENYDINIRLQDKYRYDEQALLNQFITFRDAATGKIAQVPISSVVNAGKTSTYTSVKRQDLQRVLTVKSNVLDGYNANDIIKQIKRSLRAFDLPEDVEIAFTGEQEDMAENMSFLLVALSVAMLMIFFIMVWQFNSISLPFVIMTTVLFSMIGVLFGLVIFQMDFVVVMTMIGIISLAGVVVNNGIVLVDYTKFEIENRQEELKLPSGILPPLEDIKSEIIDAGKTRLRPVILTAITTILGLVPLAIGLNLDFITLFTEFNPHIFIGGDNVSMWGPICWTIIFGLTFSTFLTLLIVPVMLLLLYKLKIKAQQKKLGLVQ